MYGVYIEVIDLNGSERLEVERFLSAFNLTLDKNIEYTFAARMGGHMVGTCSIAGKVLKCFAVSPHVQGQGVGALLVTHAVNFLFDKGIYETYIFTMPENKAVFEGMGYKTVYTVEKAALLEGGKADIVKDIRRMVARSGLDNGEKAALVMNCNPFTLGHRYLIEKAARENTQVVVFIVQQDLSAFPFEARYDLIKRGTEDLENVTVLPGGDYIISSVTFPSYFLKEENERLRAYTRLDAGIFGKYIAAAFNIKKRYVGTEPYCTVTGAYNEALAEVLPRYGVELLVTERVREGGAAVSASRVRNLISGKQWDEVKRLVPEVTYEYLRRMR